PDPVGTLVYEDDFSDIAGEDAKSGLKDQKDEQQFGVGFHTPGVFHVKLAENNNTRWVPLPRFVYGDFSLQIELWDNSDKFTGDVAQGVIFRVRDNNHLYAALLDPRKGQYAVRKLDGQDNWTDLIPWKGSELVKRKADHNILRVDAAGEKFTIYLNGRLLDQFSDASYGPGMVGMIVANVDAVTPHMHFDNLKIWGNDPAPLDPGLTPTRQDPNGDMALIPGGEFILGGNEQDEAPAQIFALPNFYLDRYEVTNEAYARCVAAQKCTPLKSNASQSHPNYATEAQYAKFPVINVTWEQANTFCGWAGKRLPTEAEWEKAASWDAAKRVKTIWPWGNVFDKKFLNSDESQNGDTTAGGQYSEEINHTFDLGGNVSEWTSSLYKPYPYTESDGREDPQAAGERVYRGGSWAQSEGKARSVWRQGADPGNPFTEVGFRCAVTP
ncbi:MAG TPA: SUMF1/EgtB/PvdO family nonheme iron enzyme, partial [Roseiflexaceae bacterium]